MCMFFKEYEWPKVSKHKFCTFWQTLQNSKPQMWCFVSWNYYSNIAPIHRAASNRNPSIGKSITGKGWVAMLATNRQFLLWQTLFQPNSKLICVHSQFWPHEDTIYLRKELNGSKIMHEAIRILFGFSLPNLKNDEKILSHSVSNACEVSQASFLKSGLINQFSCN